ncbi:MAG: TetR family transcriptional regulator [Nitrospinaceae bacterium]|nr:MAG: TetR family transcriptional regulator [Nitrospinaceae bacterium]
MKAGFVHNQENLKEKIIVVAKNIVADQGLSALNVREIAKRAECAVGMVYKVLKGIDDIVIHVNAHTLGDLHKRLKKVKRENKPEAIINELVYSYINFHKTNPHFWSALFEYHYDDEFIIPSFYEKKIEAIFLTIEEALLPVLNNNADKAYNTARILWAGAHGICSLSLCGSLSRVKIRSEKELIDTLVTDCLLSAKETVEHTSMK